ncbi:MAG: site-2 protease family protein [Patescibacteria group bacterium]
MEIIVFQIIILLFSVVIHEVSHGVVAEKLGDPTARLAGRLTLNPLKHLDPFGSVVLPFLLSLIPGGIVFGWAKPVPYNPYNLKNPEKGGALIAAAGPLSNIFLAIIFAIFYRILGLVSSPAPWLFTLSEFFSMLVLINVVLAIFNLVPIPPLDGSKVLFAILPASANRVKFALEQYGFVLVMIFIFFGFRFISPVILGIYRLLIGGI